jgi:murein DD-endopeptidase MepM/ murein hydrolase activator NlpD
MIGVIQLIVPLALLALLAFRPAQHRLTRWLQIGGPAMLLLALHLAGLWIMPPWWTPWLLWLLFMLALWRSAIGAARPGFGGADYAITLFWLLLLGVSGWATNEALRAHRPPAGGIASLALPLPKGQYYVASGGSRTILSAHLRTLPRATPGQSAYWGQSYGVDIIAVDRWGMPANGATAVVAPCNGMLVRSEGGFADGHPVDLNSPTARSGNHVLIRCGSIDILLAHFRKGSLRVAAGDHVRIGQRIATVGNSGASDMPHLHIHAQRPGSAGLPFSGQPVPMRINGHYLVRGDRP